jgi:hypothetical protein
MNANRTLAASLSVKLNVVPTGAFRARAMCGSAPPSRQRRWDWPTLLSDRGGGIPAAIVIEALAREVEPAWFEAVTWQA